MCKNASPDESYVALLLSRGLDKILAKIGEEATETAIAGKGGVRAEMVKVPYKPDEARIDYVDMGRKITEKFDAFCRRYGKNLLMRFEPGKFLSAECGTLVVEVNTIKHNRSRTIAGCNSGFPQLIRPVLYGAYHQIVNLTNPEGKPALYDVCGNICETGDRFAEQRELPEIREYDLLGIRNAGAYCYSMGSVYNLRPMPAEVVLRHGEVADFRRAQTDEELVAGVLGR